MFNEEHRIFICTANTIIVNNYNLFVAIQEIDLLPIFYN